MKTYNMHQVNFYRAAWNADTGMQNGLAMRILSVCLSVCQKRGL